MHGKQEVRFASGVDKALYIVRPGGSAKAKPAFMDWLRSLGMSDAEIAARSKDVVERVKEAARNTDGDILIGAFKFHAAPESLDEAIDSDLEPNANRLKPADLIERITTGRPAPAATAPREIWQAAQKKEWATVRAGVTRITNYLNLHLHNFLDPFEQWVRKLPVPAPLREALIGAVYRAPNVRDGVLEDAMAHGGTEVNRLLAMLAKKTKRTTETVLSDVGYALTGRHALTGNKALLARDAAQVDKARAAYDRAKTPAAAKRLSEAIAQFNSRKAAIENPDVNANYHGEFGVAGFNNAQANVLIKTAHERYGKDAVDQIAEHMDRLNAWRLAKDVETGRKTPNEVLRFLDDDEEGTLKGLLERLVVAARTVSAQHPDSLRELNAAREAVREAVKSDYVPLTGNPNQALEQDFITPGAKAPNSAADKSRQGRTSSTPDDGITSTMAAVLRTATYAGWRDFQDHLAAAWGTMTDAQRDEVGLFREKGVGSPFSQAVIRRRGGVEQRFMFRDQNLMQALRAANVETNSAALSVFAQMTKLYSFAATQLNPFFAPFNFVRDFWERSENLRARKLYHADGHLLDSNKVAKAMLALARSPRLLKATGRHAFGKPPGPWAEDRYLQEWIEQGGASSWNLKFARSRSNMIENINRESEGRRKLTKLRHFTIDAYNRTFDHGPGLAAYIAMREAGMTKEDAAAAALDLMNFRKRGASMSPISALYAFAQPSITSAANMLATLYDRQTGKLNPRAWARLAGTTLTLMAMQAFLRSLSEDDEGGNKLDQQSDLTKASFMLVPVGDSLVKLPIGYGLPRIANGMAMAILNSATNAMTPEEAFGKAVKNSIIPTVSPLSANDIDWHEKPIQAWITTFTPTWLQPPVSVAINLTPYGEPVVRDAYAQADQFRSVQFGKHIPPQYGEVARWLQEHTGVDLAPEEIRTLIRGYPLGPGTMLLNGFVENPYTEGQGRAVPNPLLKSLVTGYSPSARYFQFQDAIEDTDKLLAAKNAGQTVEGDDLIRLRWRQAWNVQDANLRKASAAVTRDKSLSETGKERRREAIQRQRDAAQNAALYRLRTALGETAARSATQTP